MNSIKIVVDSSSNLTALDGVDFACAPLKINTESKEYTGTAELDVNNMVDTLSAGPEIALMAEKCRGASKASQALIGHAKSLGYKGGKIRISHCQNESFAKDFASKISAEFGNAQIVIEECRALCSFYAEKGGMLIGFEV